MKPRKTAKKPLWDVNGPENEELLDMFLSGEINLNVNARTLLAVKTKWQEWENSSFRKNLTVVKGLAKKIMKERAENEAPIKLTSTSSQFVFIICFYYFYFFCF
jgi:hypothetical protein